MRSFQYRIKIIIIGFVISLSSQILHTESSRLTEFIYDRWIPWLDSNMIADITDSTLKNKYIENEFPDVSEMAIGNCSIFDFEKLMYKFPNTRSIAIIEFNLDSLSGLLKLLTSFRKLDMLTFVGIKLNNIPDELKLLKKVEDIEFNDCGNIEINNNLPFSLRGLCTYNTIIVDFKNSINYPNLKSIGLDLNNLNHLPKNIEKLLFLEELVLFCNKCKIIDFDFTSLNILKNVTSLTKLLFSGVDPSKAGIPESIFQKHSLQVIFR